MCLMINSLVYVPILSENMQQKCHLSGKRKFLNRYFCHIICFPSYKAGQISCLYFGNCFFFLQNPSDQLLYITYQNVSLMVTKYNQKMDVV